MYESEKLQGVPELLDAKIADKHFLIAIDILQDALRTIRKSEMESVGALSDMRVYFSNQETVSSHTLHMLALIFQVDDRYPDRRAP